MRKAPAAFNRICAAFQRDMKRGDLEPVEFIRRIIVDNSKPEEWSELKYFVDYVLRVPYTEKDTEILYYSNSPDYQFFPIKGYYVLLSKALE